VLECELLRDRPAPGDAEHVDALVPELVEKPRREPRQRPRPVGHRRHGRAAHAWNVEDDRLGTLERGEERRDELDVRADAIEHEKRWS
jgi:hypothetical protein